MTLIYEYVMYAAEQDRKRRLTQATRHRVAREAARAARRAAAATRVAARAGHPGICTA